jgi:hypothetical protein
MSRAERILVTAVVTLFLFACGGRASPDAVLFSRANEALDRGQFDVALLDLATLVNTYPKSKYAKQAESMLENDPRLDCNKPPTGTFSVAIFCPATGYETGQRL